MLRGKRAMRLMESAMSGMVRYQGVPVMVWSSVKRCWVVASVVSRTETAEKDRRGRGPRCFWKGLVLVGLEREDAVAMRADELRCSTW
jgi:hypothetical protein